MQAVHTVRNRCVTPAPAFLFTAAARSFAACPEHTVTHCPTSAARMRPTTSSHARTNFFTAARARAACGEHCMGAGQGAGQAQGGQHAWGKPTANRRHQCTRPFTRTLQNAFRLASLHALPPLHSTTLLPVALACRYDPVFQVKTIDGRTVWRRRHYRVKRDRVPGTFRFSVRLQSRFAASRQRICCWKMPKYVVCYLLLATASVKLVLPAGARQRCDFQRVLAHPGLRRGAGLVRNLRPMLCMQILLLIWRNLDCKGGLSGAKWMLCYTRCDATWMCN